ncbi:hypothetical protein GCM10025794_34560 [Massilia kyonggiensis]
MKFPLSFIYYLVYTIYFLSQLPLNLLELGSYSNNLVALEDRVVANIDILTRITTGFLVIKLYIGIDIGIFIVGVAK